jgi:PTS system nitrogen regulatory IIA component
MRITDILPAARIYVDAGGAEVHDKTDALRMLSGLLAPALKCPPETVEQLLAERERLQSTGIGDGVAIPHTSVEEAACRAAALVLCPDGVPFESIDGGKVKIVLGVVGPKDATGEHLRVLARISRVLRDEATRDALARAPSAADAFRVLESREHQLG